MVDVSIIFPIHNEAEGIKEFIKRVYRTLKKQKFTCEIICVENGSTDASYSILKNLKIQYKNLLLIQSNKGWGNAVKAGIKHAKGNYICYMVSDGQIDPKYIPLLYKKIKKKHLAMVKISRVNRENIMRLLNSRIYNIFAAVIFTLNSLDINGTPKIIVSRYIKSFSFQSENIAFDLELLLMLKEKNLSWFEIPIYSQKRITGSSTTNLKSIWEMLRYIYKFRFTSFNN